MEERNPMDISTQWLNFMKDAFGAAVEATTKAHEHSLRFFDDLANRGGIAQEESKRLLEDWLKNSRESTEAFQRQAQENFKQWEQNIPKSITAVSVATKQDVDVLTKKVEELTKKVDALSRSS